MKFSTFLLQFLVVNSFVFCQPNNSPTPFTIPDSIKASGFYAEVKISDTHTYGKEIKGISLNKADLIFGYHGKEKIIKFSLAAIKQVMATGLNVFSINLDNAWNYDWKPNITYPLLITSASDSATNSTLYSGYIFLNDEKKWKLIATQKLNDTDRIKYLSPVGNNNENNTIYYYNRWLLRSNGSWKALDSQTTNPPVLRNMSNIDSLEQQKIEEKILTDFLPNQNAIPDKDIFYQILKEGTGRLVQVTDTVTVHYKGTRFADGIVFDQTKSKPATFSLDRLIKGWQIGLTHCKIGGSIRLFIPSGIAYGIRTRSALIPPNSILVFDIEVLDAKEKK